MTIDIIASYLALNEFLEPKGYEIVPEGHLLKVMDKAKGRATFVGDTIKEVSNWVKDEFGVLIIVDGS